MEEHERISVILLLGYKRSETAERLVSVAVIRATTFEFIAAHTSQILQCFDTHSLLVAWQEWYQAGKILCQRSSSRISERRRPNGNWLTRLIWKTGVEKRHWSVFNDHHKPADVSVSTVGGKVFTGKKPFSTPKPGLNFIETLRTIEKSKKNDCFIYCFVIGPATRLNS